VSNKRKFPLEPVTAPAKGPAEFSPIANPGSNRISIRRVFKAAYHPLSRFQNSVPPEGRRAGAGQYDQLILKSKPVLLAPLNAKLFYRVPYEVLSGLNVVAQALSPNKISPVYSPSNIQV
jgi:hypothetical protein